MPRDLRDLPTKNRRCSLFLLPPADTWHHLHSEAYRSTVPARPGVNCVPVSNAGHRIIHVVLGGTGRMVVKKGKWFRGKRVARNVGAIEIQRIQANNDEPWRQNPGLWIFPNPLQSIAHGWCRFVYFITWLLWIGRNWQAWITRALVGIAAVQTHRILASLREVWLWHVIFG